MTDNWLNRRRMLAGGLGFGSAGLLPGRGPATPVVGAAAQPGVEWLSWDVIEECEQSGNGGADAARHSPFRAEFLAWLDEASDRFALPVWADVESSGHTCLVTLGLHPAVEIALSGDTQIDVFVKWEGVSWRNALFVPDAQRVHPTREACWRADGFEHLLGWFNDEFVPATHVALYGEEDSWTEALLARNGKLLRRKPSVERYGPLRHLLPMHEGWVLKPFHDGAWEPA